MKNDLVRVLVPCVTYRNAPAAIEWLSTVFGLQVQLCVPGDNGTIAHAELAGPGGMLMVSTLNDGPCGRLMTHPDSTDRKVTQSVYLVVSDADVVHQRVLANGGEIVLPLKDESYGGRGFSCRDPEGQLWHVGTYNPVMNADALRR